MKRLTCEMCGSTDLIKQDGVFVCQTCGCKYSIEEAKKMMVEGTVDVSGSTIKVDNERKIENLRTLADRAKAEGDTETAAKYFEELLREDPNNWEANFYTIYYAAHNIKIAQIGSAANRVSNIIDTVFGLIKETVPNPEDQIAAEQEVSRAIADFSSFLIPNASNNMGDTSKSVNDAVENWFLPICYMHIHLGDSVLKYFNDYYMAEKNYGIVANFTGVGIIESGRQVIEIAKQRLKPIQEVRAQKELEAKEAAAAEEKKKKDEYWAKHAPEYNNLKNTLEQLEAQKKALLKEIDDLFKQMLELPIYSVRSEKQKAISDIKRQLSNLGLFRGKEKKELQGRISSLENELVEMEKQIELEKKPIEEKIDENKKQLAKLNEQIEAIHIELNKAR